MTAQAPCPGSGQAPKDTGPSDVDGYCPHCGRLIGLNRVARTLKRHGYAAAQGSRPRPSIFARGGDA